MQQRIDSEQQLWVVGKITDIFGDAWDFIGVFDSEDKARQQCLTSKHFVGSVLLNQNFNDLPDGSQWPGGYFFPVEEEGV